MASAAPAEQLGTPASASIGIVIEPAPGTRTAAELLRDADIAMYTAKRNRKGTWEIFDTAMRRDLQALQDLRRDLRRAIEHDEFFLEYLPIVRLADAGIEGAEALVRWRHPERGVVPPLEFIAIAEESGQIGRSGAGWCDEPARTRPAGRPSPPIEAPSTSR